MKSLISNDILLGSVIDSILINIVNSDICAYKYLLTKMHGTLFSPGIFQCNRLRAVMHALPFDTIPTRQTGTSGK